MGIKFCDFCNDTHVCPDCYGEGIDPDDGYICYECEGTGECPYCSDMFD